MIIQTALTLMASGFECKNWYPECPFFAHAGASLDYFVPLSKRIYLALLTHLNPTAKSVHEGDKPFR